MMYYLLNYNKLEHLYRLHNRLDNSGDYSIWKSNNSHIIDLIDRIMFVSKNCVFSTCLIEGNKTNK